ncbi:hypothetical protein I79_012593 [Cricetulus griseus]|uniref:Uncharacterized protein n=1 Tax=Cricetulus griseus TaxID=10029 RepID=G3HP86_CRIGR|nr:hypothetical protein I79_012593 [Cricetulus griseus]
MLLLLRRDGIFGGSVLQCLHGLNERNFTMQKKKSSDAGLQFILEEKQSSDLKKSQIHF